MGYGVAGPKMKVLQERWIKVSEKQLPKSVRCKNALQAITAR